MKYVLLIFLFVVGCNQKDNSYIVKDRFGDSHKYDVNHSVGVDSTTIYCQIHYQWETIRHYYTKDGIKYWMRTLKYFK